MSFQRGIDGAEPERRAPVTRQALIPGQRQRSSLLGTGTLACPRCDAPVAPTAPRLTPAQPLSCPFCGHGGSVRDFLSLALPSRPARVTVHVRALRRPLRRTHAPGAPSTSTTTRPPHA